MTLYLGNNLQLIQRRLEAVEGSIKFLYLGDSQKSAEFRSYLQSRPNSQELPAASLIRDTSEPFREQYIDFIGQLNRNNGSLHWWAMTFPDKNPSAEDLPRSALFYSLVTSLVIANEDPLVVVTDDGNLIAQLGEWANQNEITLVSTYRANDSLQARLKTWTPIAVLSAAFKTFIYWLMVRNMRPTGGAIPIDLAIVTPTHPRCFDSENRFHDAYFAPLIERLDGSETTSMLMPLVHERPFDQFTKLRKVISPLPILPLEAFFSLGSIVACALASLKAFYMPVKVLGPVEMNGLDMTCLVKRTIRQERHSGRFFMTLRAFYAGRRFGQIVRPSRCIYAFGNLAWEKSFISGVRAESPDTRFAAFIHASVTPRHMNLLFSKDEASVTPLPDEVITTGEVVEELLSKHGNYPDGVLRAACALRQGTEKVVEPKCPPEVIKTVLVAMATSTDEYVKTLSFLDQAYSDSDDYKIVVRPHPIIPMDDALAAVKLSRDDFYSVDSGSLTESFEKSDVVLYASSTVGMEAVSKGIPAIYMDLGNVLNSDPMSMWDELKWTVSDPKELVPTIRSIDALPEEEFRERQRKGQAYINSYLKPVTEENLKPFWGDLTP